MISDNIKICMWALSKLQEKGGIGNSNVRHTDHLKGIVDSLDKQGRAVDYLNDLQISIGSQITALEDLHAQIEKAKKNIFD